MQKNLSSSFKITLLLYILIFILPLSFYFVYSSFKTIQNDTKIVHQTGWTGGAIEYLALNLESQNSQRMITDIDNTLQDISGWVIQNDKSNLYIGAESLSQDFTQVNTCWSDYKQILSQQDTVAVKERSLQCWEKIDSLAIIVEKMVYLKQKKMINLFYFSLAVAMILILLVIYMIRIYIHRQITKHAIHDHETKLFNKKYFLAELKSTCARSVRHNYPLSILLVGIDDFEKENKTYAINTKRQTLKKFGALMTSLIRTGDIACRYDENKFFILLPFTEKENALILEDHIRQAFQKNDWMIGKKIVFNFMVSEFDKKETEEAFIIRILDLLT